MHYPDRLSDFHRREVVPENSSLAVQNRGQRRTNLAKSDDQGSGLSSRLSLANPSSVHVHRFSPRLAAYGYDSPYGNHAVSNESIAR
jgi:hypothetical protein